MSLLPALVLTAAMWSSTGLGLAASPASVRPAAVLVAAVTPAVPAGMPAGLEAFSGYVPQTSCDPVGKPGALALGGLLTATYPGTRVDLGRPCPLDGSVSEHYDGRALDWSSSVRVPAQAARVATVLDWLLAPDQAGRPAAVARRLGVMYLIWNGRMWRSYAAGSGWRAYLTCGSHPEQAWDTTCHRDHLHISLSWAGAMAHTSFWTKTVAAPDYGPCRPADLNWAPPYRAANPKPCTDYPHVTAVGGGTAAAALVKSSGAQVSSGARGPVVSAVQTLLGLPADGIFGPLTTAAVSTFQRTLRLPVTGTVDAATWRALLGRFAPQRSVVIPSPLPGAPAPVPVPEPAPSPTPVVKAGPLTPYRSVVLHYDSRGAAVVALQGALHVTRSGWFGPVTLSAVLAVQHDHHLPTTGVVDTKTWTALGA